MKRLISFTLIAGLLLAATVHALESRTTGVRIWQEPLTLPTYFANAPEECPVFFENKSYQGASRVAYPYPVQDNLSTEKGEATYQALYLENEYIKVCILPEIGGRLFYATDKTNGYELFYRQSVIKPMLIGMLGAWTSGGIEFCVFHHHRASTYMPVEYKLVENADGSATIWIGEFEPRHRMRWSLGISLHPGRSWVTVDGVLMNTTENTNSFLYWANVATHVNEDYQIIFPPSTQYAVFHAKNSFAHWPITTETYNGKDYYKDNIDASWYKNHPIQGSFFAHDIDVGNLAGYDWGVHAGTMHVANPHIVKGAKLWQWGTNSTFDREALTDSDGPYAELMTGAYSDNQPDYSWIKPYEVKEFRQTWYPLRETEGMKYGNLDAVLNLELREGANVFLAANTTKRFSDARVILKHAGKVLFEEVVDIDPATPYSHSLKVGKPIQEEELELLLLYSDGSEIISYQPEVIPYNPDLPPEVIPPAQPAEIASTEELFYAGQRIRQFHNAQLSAEDYFLEALKRDSLDVRSNTAMGIIRKEQGDYVAAQKYFENALKRITANYTRPRDCEPHYHLGVIQKDLGDYKEAEDNLYRAAWDYEFRSAAYYQLALLYSLQGEYASGLEALEESLVVNRLNINARCLKASLLRLTGEEKAALKVAKGILSTDTLNPYAQNELAILQRDNAASDSRAQLDKLLRDYPENYLELAASYMGAGLYPDAAQILNQAASSKVSVVNSYPTVHYYIGYLHHQMGDEKAARKAFAKAKAQPIDYCFPFRLESRKVYLTALDYDARDSRACYYMGNLFYDHQPEYAISWWEKAVKYEPGLAMAHRNLGWGYDQTLDNQDKAMAAYRTAIEKDPSHPRFFAELDRLFEDAGEPVESRLKLLADNHDQVNKYQGAIIREILVLVLAGQFERAIELMDGRTFYRQEDVNIIHELHVDAHLLKGIEQLKSEDPDTALKEFLIADTYPENQMIERPLGYDRNAQIYYYSGLAKETDGNHADAREFFTKASNEETTGQYQYYQALALHKLGKAKQANNIFAKMIREGEARLAGSDDVDFFAKFEEDMTAKQRLGISYQIMALGHLGQGDKASARKLLRKSLESDVNQSWSKLYLSGL
ncbi:MAG: DUF5107 domain-containing protein [Puniceicoccaceae bacterium]